MKIQFHKKFVKQLAKLNPKIQLKFYERLEIFEHNQVDPLLNNHKLNPPFHGLRSINISGDYRAIYQEDKGVFYFVLVGNHSELYK